MSDYFDRARITQLQEVMGREAGAILSSMLDNLTGAIEHVEAALGAGQLDRAIQPAHAARNDALMLGARPLQDALRDLEAAARGGNETQARSALGRVQAAWPPTRDALITAAGSR